MVSLRNLLSFGELTSLAPLPRAVQSADDGDLVAEADLAAATVGYERDRKRRLFLRESLHERLHHLTIALSGFWVRVRGEAARLRPRDVEFHGADAHSPADPVELIPRS